jgi:hypothetical protein
MSSIPYSGGTIVNTTFTTTSGTRQEIVTALETQLTAAGWSVISGSGTGTVVMKSAVTASPKANSIRVRLLEVGSGNCAQIKIENDAGTLTSQAYYLLPSAGKVFRIIACKYNFFCFNAVTTTARSFVAAGTLHIPDFLDGVTTADLGWIQGNGASDSDATIRQTFRTTLDLSEWCSQIRNAALLNLTTIGFGSQSLKAVSLCGRVNSNTNGYRWVNNALVSAEAAMGFSVTGSGDENKMQGMIHNCMVISDTFAGDDISVTSYDSHSWFAITQSHSGSSAVARGTLFVAIT